MSTTGGNRHTALQEQELAADVAAGRCDPCPECRGHGQRGPRYSYHVEDRCTVCDGIGFFGLEANKPTQARPGSLMKVAILAKRYFLGIELEMEGDLNIRTVDDAQPSDAGQPEFMLPQHNGMVRDTHYAERAVP